MGRIVEKHCPCGRVYELLRMADRDTNLAREENIDDLSCPACGGTEAVETFGTGRTLQVEGAGYPYFDAGLGELIQSRAHRREVMKRLGVVDAEGEAETEMRRIRGEQNAAHEKWKAEFERDQAMQADDPDIRQARARVADAVREAREKADRWTGVDVQAEVRKNLGGRS